MAKKLWGGSYRIKLHPLAEKLIVNDEQNRMDTLLLPDYLLETTAHVQMLAKQRIISTAEGKQLTAELKKVRRLTEQGLFVLDPSIGDVHENIETYLITALGDTGKKVHTARSRNDQIETDTRLYLKRHLLSVLHDVASLKKELTAKSLQSTALLMPGYTHLQVAQPMTVGFWLNSYVAAIERDEVRLQELVDRVDLSPLGSGAGFGVPYPIDRDLTASLLGFTGVESSPLDAVGSRGELVAEAMWLLGLLMTHVGKLANELILFSTPEFGFFTLGEEFTTGSSIMPQKRNPDILELVRAQSAVLFAEANKIAMLIRNLPSGYNRDTRESKTSLKYLPEVSVALQVMTELMKTLQANPKAMRVAIDRSFATATALADSLVQQKGITFRDAHEISGKLVRYCQDHDKIFASITDADLNKALTAGKTHTVKLTAAWVREVTDPATVVKKLEIPFPERPDHRSKKQKIKNAGTR